VVSVLELLFKD